MISHNLRGAASWEETGHGPGTWPSGLGGAAAAAGAGAAGDLHSASPCGLVPGHLSRDDDASLGSNHLRPYRLRINKTKDTEITDFTVYIYELANSAVCK